MENALSNEEEARTVRRAEREGEYIIDPNRDSQLGLESIPSGCKSFGINRDDGSAKFALASSEAFTGKVIDELIHECLNQITTKAQELKFLESKLENLNTLRNELGTDITEDK